MPTVGWIREAAIDRISDAFPPQWERPEAVYCQVCDRSFADDGLFRQHLKLDHPLKQPMLWIGRQAGMSLVVRNPEELKEIRLENTTSCILMEPGKPRRLLSPKELKDRLRTARNTHYQILLRNERSLDGGVAEIETAVEVAIPDPGLCMQVEDRFRELLAVERPTVNAVDRFMESAPSEPAVRAYAGALADYVLGVLLKEQNAGAGAIGDFANYKEKFTCARRVLCQFDRSLAGVVVATIDFNFNRFEPDHRSAVPLLDGGHRFFSCFRSREFRPSRQTTSAEAVETVPACPVDHITSGILTCVASFPAGFVRHTGFAIDDGDGRHPVGEYDRRKLEVLQAAGGLLNADRALALRYLRNLMDDHHFGDWARRQLEILENND